MELFGGLCLLLSPLLCGLPAQRLPAMGRQVGFLMPKKRQVEGLTDYDAKCSLLASVVAEALKDSLVYIRKGEIEELKAKYEAVDNERKSLHIKNMPKGEEYVQGRPRLNKIKKLWREKQSLAWNIRKSERELENRNEARAWFMNPDKTINEGDGLKFAWICDHVLGDWIDIVQLDNVKELWADLEGEEEMR